MLQTQKDFLKNEVWLLSFGGAFQRNSIYNEGISKKKKDSFRKELQTFMENVILPTYKNTLDDSKHRAMIYAIIENSTMYKAILKNGSLSVGTAQKLLNLSLKYYWCLGYLPEPPHFPVDSRIQTKLPYKSRKNWTSINSLDEYQTIIDCARGLLKDGESLANWELANFKRS